MKQKLFSWTTAGLITLCAVLLSMLLGANLSLNGLRREAQNIYLYGVDGSGRGVESDLEYIVSEALTLSKLARNYLDDRDSALLALDGAVDAYHQADTVSDKGAAATLLEDAVYALDERLDEEELSDNDRSIQKLHADNIEFRYLVIWQSGYNEAAQAFNKALWSFPGGFLGNLTGVEPLELFE